MARKMVCDRCGTESTVGVKDYKDIETVTLDYVKASDYSDNEDVKITKDLCKTCTKDVIKVITEDKRRSNEE